MLSFVPEIKSIGLMHRHHHRAVIIRLKHRLARFLLLHPFDAAQHFKTFRKCVEVFAFGGIDDANAFERNVQFLGGFFDFRAIAKQNRRAESQRIKLPRRLQDARFSAFRENDAFRMALQLFDDTADKSHGRLVTERW